MRSGVCSARLAASADGPRPQVSMVNDAPAEERSMLACLRKMLGERVCNECRSRVRLCLLVRLLLRWRHVGGFRLARAASAFPTRAAVGLGDTSQGGLDVPATPGPGRLPTLSARGLHAHDGDLASFEPLTALMISGTKVGLGPRPASLCDREEYPRDMLLLWVISGMELGRLRLEIREEPPRHPRGPGLLVWIRIPANGAFPRRDL